MHGIPISSVAPRGTLAGVPVVASRMVSAELFRLSDSRTVDTLLVDTMLACFSCAITAGDLGFALIVPPASFSSCSGGRGLPFVFAGVEGFDGVGGATLDVDRAIDFRVAVDLVDIVDRTDVEEAVRLATGFGGSTGLPPLMEGVVLEATDGGRLGTRGVLAPVVCTLVVDTVDAADDLRVRATLLTVSSDRAVSNAVEFSLVLVALEDNVDARDEPDGVRRVEGPATPFRIVDAVERVDLIDAATDFGLGGRSVVAVEWMEDAVLLRTLAVVMLLRGIGLGLGERGDFARSPSTRLARDGEGVVIAGVSLESGRRLLGESGTRRFSVVVEARDAVECVLRAIDRTEAAEDLTASRPATERATLRMECKLTVSDSSARATGPFRTTSLPPRDVEDGVAGMSSSVSSLSSNSAPVILNKSCRSCIGE